MKMKLFCVKKLQLMLHTNDGGLRYLMRSMMAE